MIYPAGITPAKISEPHGLPRDGICTAEANFTSYKNPEKPVVLSLEVFNESYYKQDALLVAKTGLAKMRAVTQGI